MNTAVLDKIRKLLRLGKSSNPHEAAAAIAAAFALARKHQVDLESLDLADDEEIERLLITVGARLSFERLLILNLVKRFFRVDVIGCLPNVAFIGRQTDIAIARYAHDFLLTSLRRGMRDFSASSKRKPSLTKRKNYIQGWVYGVASKLESASEQLAIENSKYALVAVDEDPRVSAATAQYYPHTTSRPIPKVRKNPSALMEGYGDGRKVDVRKPITGPSVVALPPAEKQMSLF